MTLGLSVGGLGWWAVARKKLAWLKVGARDQATGVGMDGVEFLVMKAVCIGVIDATIDEVAGTVAVTRVQPRVLTNDALGVMADKLEKWCSVVKETLVMVEESSPELLA